ncbi:MAG: hypothetical protein ACREA9_02295 [Pyrinomonadaceae bacterium]
MVETVSERLSVKASWLLLDVSPDPVTSLPWGALILLLVIVFVLSVAFVGALVALLIWFKRRKAEQADSAAGVSSQ